MCGHAGLDNFTPWCVYRHWIRDHCILHSCYLISICDKLCTHMHPAFHFFRLHHSHQSGGGSRTHGRATSPTMGSVKSGSEGRADRENQSYTTSSLQLLDLMDTLFARCVAALRGKGGNPVLLLYHIMCKQCKSKTPKSTSCVCVCILVSIINMKER